MASRLTGCKLFVAVLGCGLLASSPAFAHGREHQKKDAQSAGQEQDEQQNPLNRPLSAKQTYKQEKQLETELSKTYRTWLNQDVVYIISPQERKAFLSLSNDEERDAFIEQFWQRRNPDPDSPENAAREEHYRRIAYANEHFAAGEPGWRTDRGRIYIEWGPPDSIDSHPSGGEYERPFNEGGGETTTFPFEVWHYRYLPGIGENVNIEFVDTCMCGDYHFTLNPEEKDALLHVPGAGLTNWEEMNHKGKQDRFNCAGVGFCGGGPAGDTAQGKEFDRIEMAAKLFAPPPQQFKDLNAFVTEHKILDGATILPFDVRTDYVKVTDNMDLVPITLQFNNKDLTFVTKDGVSKGVLDILGKFTTLTDRTVQTFEDQVEVEQPSELLQNELKRKSVYWKAIPLPPGLYRLDVVVKDVNNPDHIGIYGRGVNVPEFHDEKLGASSLILADKMHKVPSSDIGGGNFVIGDMFVRPRVSAPSKPVSFQRGQDLSFWMQVYNLGINQATKSNSATVIYQIRDAANGDVVLQKEIPSSEIDRHSDQLTVDKTLTIAGLQPGKYNVTVKVNDEISKQEIAQSAPFVVE